MSEESFGHITSSLDPPLAVVTTAVGPRRAGCVIGFHAQSGMDPRRYTVWLSKANHTYRVGLHATHLAVHFLTADDLDVARHFGTRSGEDVDKFDGVEYAEGPGGVPLLAACPHRLVLRRVALLDEGSDHVCLSGEVLEVRAPGTFTPLRLSDAAHLDPGRSNEERVLP